jgi:hypothetical protein
LPFLADGVDDEDEVLAAISAALGKLVPYVGGPSHVHTLLEPLEILLSVGEFLFEYIVIVFGKWCARYMYSCIIV